VIDMENLPTPNIIDILAAVIIFLGAMRGGQRGLSGEMARLASVAVALVIGIACHSLVGTWLTAHSRLTPKTAETVSFIVTVVGALGVMILVRTGMEGIGKLTLQKAVDKSAGVVAGCAGSVVVVIIIFLLAHMWPNAYVNRIFGQDSIIGRLITPYAPSLSRKVEELPVSRSVRAIKRRRDMKLPGVDE